MNKIVYILGLLLEYLILNRFFSSNCKSFFIDPSVVVLAPEVMETLILWSGSVK